MFEAKEWASLTGRSILPKLAYCLDHEFTVNPVNQKLEPWEWAMAWSAVLPRSVFISLTYMLFGGGAHAGTCFTDAVAPRLPSLASMWVIRNRVERVVMLQ